MPIVQTALVRQIPARLQGQSWAPPSSTLLTPTCDAEEIPDLAADGVAGQIRVLSAKSATPRRGSDGLPLLWRVEFCVVAPSGEVR